MSTLASVADPRLFDPRVSDDNTHITAMGMQQTSVQVELPNATGQIGTTEPGDLFHLRQGLLLDHSGTEGVSSRSTLSHLDYWSRNDDPFFGFWYLHICYLHYGSTALRSLIYVDVGEPTSHPCSMTGMMQDHHLLAPQDFESLGTSMSEICYDIAKQYWAAWGLSESVVFHVVSWVSSWVVLVFWLGFGLLCFVFVLFWRYLAFCSHLFSNMRELPIKDKTFWWPSEPRARTAWAQKKNIIALPL